MNRNVVAVILILVIVFSLSVSYVALVNANKVSIDDIKVESVATGEVGVYVNDIGQGEQIKEENG